MPVPSVFATPGDAQTAVALDAKAVATSEPAAGAVEVRQLSPIMPLDQVRVGMKGYGMSVFHGTKIEPFPVEVISVQRDFAPKRGVIWIRCSDERMQKSGPVQGMSGSPIYLWDQGETQEPGKGGKMIGAFAFGFAWTKDCYAGVQPIELMRETGAKIDNMKSPDDKSGGKTGARSDAGRSRVIGASLIDLMNHAEKEGLDERAIWRTQTFAKLVGVKRNDTAGGEAWPQLGTTQLAGVEGQVSRLMLPMSVSSASMAKALAPLLEPMGISPMQAPAGTMAGLPPPGVDAKAIKLEPGSVLSIPLAFGDMDLSASGTVTDVLPDGRVLGFGHPMFGMGDSAMPMATGYVHFVVPRMSTAFKLGGSGVIHGTILQDDAAAVAGAPKIAFKTAPVVVHVNFGKSKKTYKYSVVHHDRMTPSLVAAVVIQSLTADQNLPTENTLRLKGVATFEGDRKVDLNACMAPGLDQRLMFELVPIFATMAQNQHGAVGLTALELTLDVTEKIEQMAVMGVRVDKPIVEPGETIKATVMLQPYGQERVTQRVEIKVPESLANGKYVLTIGDARMLNRMLMMNRPHLMQTASVDDVYDMVKMITAIRQDTLYTVLQLPPTGIAVGRQELPRLPGSKRALIASAQDTITTHFADWVQVDTPMKAAIGGDVMMEIEVKAK